MERINADKFNEITYAIGQLQMIIGYSSNANERVFSRYTPEVVAAYKARCEEMDARESAASDTKGTY